MIFHIQSRVTINLANLITSLSIHIPARCNFIHDNFQPNSIIQWIHIFKRHLKTAKSTVHLLHSCLSQVSQLRY